jgi:glutathione S-transferase
VEKEKDEFFNKLLKSLDGQLKGKKNFCGNEVTVADL